MMKKLTKLQKDSNFSRISWNKLVSSPQDFIVKEHISPRYLRKHSFVGSRVIKKKGKNILALLKKTNLTTDQALNIISEKLEIKKHDIGFAGLKDRHAVTEQYITVPKSKFTSIKSKQLKLEKVTETNNKLSPGDLVENEFIIILHNANIKNKQITFLPNYFGFQRFGAKQDNHILGKQILQGKFAKRIDKKKKKFLIHAYQSYLFNQMLDKIKKPTTKEAPIIGCNTKLGNDNVSKIYKKILKKEKICVADFDIKNAKMKCIGGTRPLYVKPIDFSVKKVGDKTILRFILPKGSYATVLVEQIMAS